MPSTLYNKINKIAIGFRYVRLFSIESLSGQLVDDLLRDSKSPFSNKLFSQVRDDGHGGKMLCDNEHGDSIVISRDDIIITVELKDFEKEFKTISTSYLPYLISLMGKYEIPRITRQGAVFVHQFSKSERGNVHKRISSIFPDRDLKEPNDLLLRVTKKLPTLGGIALRNKNDYKNLILTFESTDDDFSIAVDYQEYFDPFLSSIKAVNSESFMQTAKEFVGKQHEWMKNWVEHG